MANQKQGPRLYVRRMKAFIKQNSIYLVVILICSLLVSNIILTYYNNEIIKRNRQVQEEVERVRIYYDQVGKVLIHSLDVGLRGYALIRTERFAAPLDNAIAWKDSIISHTETSLRNLGYDFSRYHVFCDSLNAYIRYCFHLKELLLKGDDAEFLRLFALDKGANVWKQYLDVEADIKAYVSKIDVRAQEEYGQALFRNQIIQVVLFLIGLPTIGITAFNTVKNFKLNELLRKAQAERNKLLREQNTLLEQRVAERMQKIVAQNEEIMSQSEELSAQRDTLMKQNRQLQEAQRIIEQQNQEIQSMNEYLKSEVENRTRELQIANQELVEQNRQLEQFAFIAAHNLRSPLTRILGLANLFKLTESPQDKEEVLQKLVSSTRDLDEVIRDLNAILNIKRNTSNLEEVDLSQILTRVKKILRDEIRETQAVLHASFDEASKVYAVTPYVESILYNLLSNSIKYRNPERKPVIAVKTTLEGDFVCLSVTDNGLGIDLVKHGQHIFSLYKRFHFHMEGKGLGLYLVKTQVEAMGGKVDVRSQPNEGTTFLVYLKPFPA